MTELWKDIKGYEGLYQISNLGRVRRLESYVDDVFKGKSRRRKFKCHVLKLLRNNVTGYLSVNLSKDGKHKRLLVHIIVAQAFIPNPDNLPQVNHKDEDKTNNQAENLEWCSSNYNANYGDRNYKSSVSRMPYTKDTVISVYCDILQGKKLSDIKSKYGIGKRAYYCIKSRSGAYGRILSEAGI